MAALLPHVATNKSIIQPKPVKRALLSVILLQFLHSAIQTMSNHLKLQTPDRFPLFNNFRANIFNIAFLSLFLTLVLSNLPTSEAKKVSKFFFKLGSIFLQSFGFSLHFSDPTRNGADGTATTTQRSRFARRTTRHSQNCVKCSNTRAQPETRSKFPTKEAAKVNDLFCD